jgi:integrase
LNLLGFAAECVNRSTPLSADWGNFGRHVSTGDLGVMAGKARLVVPFNVQAVKSARAMDGRVTEYQVGAERGLKLLVLPSGVATYLLRYDMKTGEARVQRKLKLGRRDAMSLAEARAQADIVRRDIEAGKDPTVVAEQRKNALTFKKLFDQRMAKDLDLADSTKRLYREALASDVLPAIGALPIEEVTTAHILSILDRIEARGSIVQADRTRSAIGSMYAWARKRGLYDGNPAAGLGRRAPSSPRTRVLADAELALLWSALDHPDAELSTGMISIIRLAILTGQRRTEVAGAKRSELLLECELPLWTIPGDTRKVGKVVRGRTKNRRTQMLPLSRQAAHLFRDAIKRTGRSDHVFPAGRIPGETEAETRVPHVNGESVSRAMRRLRVQFGIDDVTIHDMRRSIATWLGEQGTRPDVIDKILNHTPRDVTRLHYNFAGLDGLVRAALQSWADHVETIAATGKSTAIEPAAVSAQM